MLNEPLDESSGFFAADVDPDLRRRQESSLNDEQRKRFFRETLPLLKTVVTFALDEQAASGAE